MIWISWSKFSITAFLLTKQGEGEQVAAKIIYIVCYLKKYIQFSESKIPSGNFGARGRRRGCANKGKDCVPRQNGEHSSLDLIWLKHKSHPPCFI